MRLVADAAGERILPVHSPAPLMGCWKRVGNTVGNLDLCSGVTPSDFPRSALQKANVSVSAKTHHDERGSRTWFR